MPSELRGQVTLSHAQWAKALYREIDVPLEFGDHVMLTFLPV